MRSKLSLAHNILANYASQIYVTAVGILVLPLYIKYMGAEVYGLVGFFTMLQAWFVLLDFGLTPTIGRETARFHGGVMSTLAYRQLFRALSLIFIGIAVIGGTGLWLLSGVIATRWLNVTELPLVEVVLAMKIMGISVALRWMGGLYRGVVTGAERMVGLSIFNALIATLRFVAVFASMWLFGFSAFVFFIHQLVIALAELLGLFLMSRRLLPTQVSLDQPVGWSFRPIKPLLKFALTIAITTSVWILVTQTDKLVLSGFMPLEEYGYFTLAVLVAGGILVISGPISSAIMPRLAKLHAEGKHDEMIKVYRNATQLVSIIGGSAAITLATFAEPLLFAWTGDAQLAAKAAPIMRLYAIGNGLLVVGAFTYYLQYAKGNLRYHLIGNAGMAVVLIPSIVFAAMHFGGIGAGYVWLGINAFSFLLWGAYIHHKLEPGLHLSWLFQDVAKIILLAMLPPLILVSLGVTAETRLLSLAMVVMGGLVSIAGALAGSTTWKSWMLGRFACESKIKNLQS
ncbi:oligosaccharide flippase family protein [Pseudomonas sp. DB1]|uniref:Oligosaccharide flippase family protein n=1 Tax=Metapseudomonas boanensis TaxID=2822138 RepID=A0ABS5XDM8_9GAMM|nr:oligosaccharide flippase family protein [Pseudomonas boanensis]